MSLLEPKSDMSLTSCWLASSLHGIPSLLKSNPPQRSSRIIRVFCFSFFNLFRIRSIIAISLSPSNFIPSMPAICS
ncbi:hypothetical protein VIGAN_04093900 [Vigna angularis var. angularis]|uniref:Uncharacterized protein n=1 Tax=Vigna angularis var. angularis TaxID=157739 RepID=A0A0S3RT52_PHAAN|nr:hypothetical protein VIGAN_04093900 [Vigna angularis var. angularis]